MRARRVSSMKKSRISLLKAVVVFAIRIVIATVMELRMNPAVIQAATTDAGVAATPAVMINVTISSASVFRTATLVVISGSKTDPTYLAEFSVSFSLQTSLLNVFHCKLHHVQVLFSAGHFEVAHFATCNQISCRACRQSNTPQLTDRQNKGRQRFLEFCSARTIGAYQMVRSGLGPITSSSAQSWSCSIFVSSIPAG